MRQQSLCTTHMEIKKRTQDGNPNGTHKKHHNHNTPRILGCQMEEKKSE